MKINEHIKTILAIVIVIAIIVIGANIVKNISDKGESTYGQKEASKEIEQDETLKKMQEVANKAYENSQKLNKAIGNFVLQYVSKQYAPTVTNVKALEMDNYGRCLYYVTVNTNSGTRYYYVVIYDINKNNATFKYTSSAVVEDSGQTAIQKQYAKNYNNWNKPLK